LLPINWVMPTRVSVDEATASRRAVKLMNNQHQHTIQADGTWNTRCLCTKKTKLFLLIFWLARTCECKLQQPQPQPFVCLIYLCNPGQRGHHL
jgi:hypothetical protein